VTTGRAVDATAALLRAIDLEIEAILTGSATNVIPLRLGARTAEDGDGFEYVFHSARAAPDIAPRSLIRLSTRRARWERATAAVLPDGKIRVTTPADLGSEPANAQLCEDATGSLEQLAERISAAGRPGGVNAATADLVLGVGAPRIARSADAERLIEGYHGLRLNERQRNAIEQALASDITFIWGPPGTGKTEVVSRIVEGCFRQDLRVLFLSPTHVAVDQALERICVLLERQDGFGLGLVQRAGQISSPSLEHRFGPAISPDRIGDRMAEEIARRAGQLTAQLEAVRSSIALHSRSAAAERRLRECDEGCHSLERRAADADAALRQSTQSLWSAQQERQGLGSPSGIFAQRKQRRIEALAAEIAGHQATVDQARADRDRALADLPARRAEQQSAADEVHRRHQQLDGIDAVDRLQGRAQQLGEDLAQVETARREVMAAVRTRCRVLGTTVQKAVQSGSLMDQVDVVVIDEAGMVALPWAWCAAGLADKRVVVAGDFRQLPAVTRGSSSRSASAADLQHSQRWMDCDAFTAAGLVNARGAAKPDARMVCLDTQYRMRPAICAVVNDVAYPDAPLRTGRNDDSGALPGSALLPGPLILVDTSSRQMPVEKRQGAHLSNTVHEALIHELVRGLQYDGVLPTRKAAELSVANQMAVIAPYREQATALQRSLRYRFGTDFDGFADTVHRFQGSQRPIVVVDTVAGAGDKPGLFYEGTGLSSQTCRLLNVTLSRAQDHLVVVADVDFLESHVARGSEVDRMLVHLRRHADRLSVDDLIPVRTAADLAGLREDDVVRPAFFPADEVPRAVLWDIERARESIDVYCPFLDPTPVRTWLRRFAVPLAKPVRVTVHTREQEAGTTRAALVQELIDAGCQVETRERMHEKVVIVDDRILWHGSLNLLANTGPTDLMMRYVDPTACERVKRIVSAARMERPARTWNGAIHSTLVNSEVGPGAVVDGRLYLQVPIGEKDEAKRLVRARWDPQRRLWHVAVETPRDRVARWLPDS
jgi:AAA domain-containing protein/uncharacterized protein DUF5710/phospholipase D-like protein